MEKNGLTRMNDNMNGQESAKRSPNPRIYRWNPNPSNNAPLSETPIGSIVVAQSARIYNVEGGSELAEIETFETRSCKIYILSFQQEDEISWPHAEFWSLKSPGKSPQIDISPSS